MEPGGFQGLGLVGQEDAVGGQRKIRDRRFVRQQGDELCQVLAEQRLTTRDPHSVDPKTGKDVDEGTGLFKREDVSAGEPTHTPPPACSTDSGGCTGP